MPPPPAHLLQSIRDAVARGAPEAVLPLAPRLFELASEHLEVGEADFELRRVDFPPAHDTGVHDHSTWSLDVLLQGSLELTEYEVLSRPSPDELEIAVRRRRVLQARSTFLVHPGDLHRVVALTAAATLHVGGVPTVSQQYRRAGLTYRPAP